MSIHGVVTSQPRVGLIEQEYLQARYPFRWRHHLVLVVIDIHPHTDLIPAANICTPDRRSALTLHWRWCHRGKASTARTATASAGCVGIGVAIVDGDVWDEDHDGLLNSCRAGGRGG